VSLGIWHTDQVCCGRGRLLAVAIAIGTLRRHLERKRWWWCCVGCLCLCLCVTRINGYPTRYFLLQTSGAPRVFVLQIRNTRTNNKVKIGVERAGRGKEKEKEKKEKTGCLCFVRVCECECESVYNGSSQPSSSVLKSHL
jgi:hypothetical protein